MKLLLGVLIGISLTAGYMAMAYTVTAEVPLTKDNCLPTCELQCRNIN